MLTPFCLHKYLQYEVSIRKKQIWNKVLRRRKAFLIKVCEHAWIHLQRVFNFWKQPDEAKSGVGEIRRSSSWGILCFGLGFNFAFCSLLPAKIRDGSQGCPDHLCVLLIPATVAQILLWPKPSAFLVSSPKAENPTRRSTSPSPCQLPGTPMTASCTATASRWCSAPAWQWQQPAACSQSQCECSPPPSCLVHSSELLVPPENSCWSMGISSLHSFPQSKTFVWQSLLSGRGFGPCLPFRWDLNFSGSKRIRGNLRTWPHNWVSEMRFDTEVLPCWEISTRQRLLCLHQNIFPLSPLDSLTLLHPTWRATSCGKP